jgi:hypothetical protein
MRVGTIIFAITSATCAHAAEISVDLKSGAMPTVRFAGPIVVEDAERFFQKVSPLPQATIVLNSDGGSAIAGIAIGEIVREKQFHTLVPSNARCASACALAWLGGTQRFMASGARIGFHAAYNSETGQETGMGNALIGAYLNKIGLPSRAVIYITKAPPQSMTWLDANEAARQGIQVTTLANNAPPATGKQSVDVPSAKPPPKRSDNRCEVSLAQYQLLDTGMSYAEARLTLGCDGLEVLRNGIGGHQTVAYRWSGSRPGTAINTVFQNDRLVSKSQIGFR